ncbi:MAG: hypothetical protein ACREXY_12390 [Gammaproteobacteria bacterium]
MNSLLGNSDEGLKLQRAEKTSYSCPRIFADELTHWHFSDCACSPSSFAETLRRARR